MKPTLKLFRIGLLQTAGDGMLVALLVAPFLIGALVKWGVPLGNSLAMQYFQFSLKPWYALIDGFMLVLIPAMLSIISAFLLLDERDEGTSAYYQITPVQGYTYLLARIGLPMGWAFVCNSIVGVLFSISGLSILSILAAALIGTGAGAACAMMVVALAENRVEGLAISKLMGVSLLGVLAAWFIPAPYHYLTAFLPSFWVGEITRYGTNLPLLGGGIFTCVVWIAIFIKRFLRKI